jgi:hypothetical protein
MAVQRRGREAWKVGDHIADLAHDFGTGELESATGIGELRHRAPLYLGGQTSRHVHPVARGSAFAPKDPAWPETATASTSRLDAHPFLRTKLKALTARPPPEKQPESRTMLTRCHRQIRTTTRLEGDRFAIDARGHTITVDQPADVGGADTAPTPTELFVASLAGCVGFYAAGI